MYRFEKGGHAKGGIQAHPTLGGKTFALSEACAWLELLLAALDCYNWVLEEQLVAPSEVFMCESISCTFLCHMEHKCYYIFYALTKYTCTHVYAYTCNEALCMTKI